MKIIRAIVVIANHRLDFMCTDQMPIYATVTSLYSRTTLAMINRQIQMTRGMLHSLLASQIAILGYLDIFFALEALDFAGPFLEFFDESVAMQLSLVEKLFSPVSRFQR